MKYIQRVSLFEKKTVQWEFITGFLYSKNCFIYHNEIGAISYVEELSSVPKSEKTFHKIYKNVLFEEDYQKCHNISIFHLFDFFLGDFYSL